MHFLIKIFVLIVDILLITGSSIELTKSHYKNLTSHRQNKTCKTHWVTVTIG
jgi:hypothetical protein